MTVHVPLDFLKNECIAWDRIGRAVAFYESLGYQYVEVPWVVPSQVIDETLPPDGIPFNITSPGGDDFGGLVGSAEQSFLWLEKLGDLPSGRFVGVSPCFRHNKRSPIHQKTFLKVELYSRTSSHFQDMLLNAQEFFRSEGASGDQLRPITTDHQSRDLYVNGIEVGSYGVRESEFSWAYGTGLAEPRFSQALQLHR